MLDGEKQALLSLMLVPGLGHARIGRCIDRFGSAAATLDAPAASLTEINGIPRNIALGIREKLDSDAHRQSLDEELAALEKHNVSLLALDDAAYPTLLKHIPDPPRLLWVRGGIIEDDALALAMVGARRCSHYGREQADRFAYQCASAGLTIVSGGAYGVDVAAHRAALKARGRTIAVIGSGLANPYPSDHAKLFDEMAASGGGAVISELPMNVSPNAENFPRRNRIISGLSLGVLVVEAAARSGALITARLCVEEHGRELMAVPGRVDSKTSDGCHKMIREGWAKLVTNAADVLDGLGEAGQLLKAGVTVGGDGDDREAKATQTDLFDSTYSDPQKAMLAALDQPRTLDEIAAHAELPVQRVQSELTMLEIRGAVKRQGATFVRKR